MTGFSDYSANAFENWLTGQLAMPALASVYLALFTAVGVDAGTGFTEVSGGSYARQQVAGPATVNGTTASGNATLNFASVPAWIQPGMSVRDVTASSVIPAATTVLSKTATTVVMSANASGAGVGATDVIQFSAFTPPTGSAPSLVSNNSVVTFVTATADWGTVMAFGLYDALTVGNLFSWDYLGNFSWLPVEVSAASPGVLTAKAHGYANGDSFVFSTEYGGTAPTFSAGNYTGLKVVAGQTTDTFNVTGVNTSASGSGAVRKVQSQSVPNGITASFPAATFVISAA